MTYRQIGANTQLSEIDNITDRITTRKMSRNQEISRLTLGEIGNRVCAIKIDATKDQPLKKEVPQPKDPKLTFRRAARTNIPSISNVGAANKQVSKPKENSKNVTAEVAHADVKVECTTNKPQLVAAPRITSSDIVLADSAHNVAPMDVSGDGLSSFSKVLFAEQVEDIDKDDKTNPQQVSVYVNSIYSYMRQLEKKYSIRQNLLQCTEITGKMRAILIDWLCQVHNKFHLLQETFYLTVAILDRYLQLKPCGKSRLQLVGVTAMLIASKYEEMYAPQVADFVYITDKAYTKQDVLDMEHDILRALDFSLGRPHCLHFLRRNSKAAQASASVHTLAKYLMELSLLEYEMAHLAPSYLAAAALHLSMLVHDGSSWSPTLQFYSSYSVEELMPLVHSLALLVVKAGKDKLKAVKNKYASSGLMKIALIPQLKSETLLDLALASLNTRKSS